MYIPSFLKAAITNTRTQILTFKDLVNTNIQSTSSFKYEPLNYPLKNTQQLNLDWSAFENHTFFSSAEVKVNMAFDQIINGYPFDGRKDEVENFFESMGGFEKWVFDQFPKFSGQLHFSSSWINIKDSAGWLYPDISKNKTGESILNPPPDKSFTIEMQLFVPDQTNSDQIIFQKLSEDLSQGFTFYLQSSTDSFVTASFIINSASVNNSVNARLEKGKFNHVCISLNRETENNLLEFFVNEKLESNSKKEKNIQEFNDVSNLVIGSGSSFYINNTYVTPTQTFSGTLDEFRVFHSYRTLQQQKAYKGKGLYASDSLKLYYRFNEPPTSLSSNSNDVVNSIVLDSSGNSLHSYITNFTSSLRQSAAADDLSQIKNEKQDFTITLFPYNPDIITLNTNLLASASIYDEQNPNLITKLIPRHYLIEGAEKIGYPKSQIEGTITDQYSGNGPPGSGQPGSTQIILTFLYIWSKFFDEMKMFVDAFSTLKSVDYNLKDTVPDSFLLDLMKDYGFFFQPLFNESSTSQYSDKEDITKIEVNDVSLKKVQAYLLRRILVNINDVIKSKGTQHSIKSFLRSIGIDPDNSVRIREYGGPSIRKLGDNREEKTEYYGLVNFQSSSLATTQYLSCSRVEPGYPEPVGPFVDGISSYPADGLLTSGSWTFEGIYKSLNKSGVTNHSLARLEVTGSSASAMPGLVVNVVASNSSVDAYFRPGMSLSSPILTLSLPTNILNGEKWNVSFGRQRNDSIKSNVSSSYFLRVAKQSAEEAQYIHMTSSYFHETPLGESNVFQTLDSSLNASGSMIAIGNNENIPEGVGYYFLNSSLDASSKARSSELDCQVSNVRFWSKALTVKEWKEHIKNYKSYGVESPTKNYNYVTALSGSFEKLRLSIMEKQTEKTADTDGKIKFLDFSENELFAIGTGFSGSSQVYVSDVFNYSYFSPYFDEYSTTEKIRIRGFLNEENLEYSPYASMGPIFEVPAGETPQDDTRLSIEISLVDALNKDIINMFATLDEISNAIGAPELAFSPDYPGLERLRDIYFNRLFEKLNFRGFFEFYRWFDTSVSTFIDQLVPRKTKFKGTNFVIESHMLERHKIEYQSSEIYLGDSTRSRIRDVLLSQQVVGKISKY